MHEFENTRVDAGLPGEAHLIDPVWHDPDDDFGGDPLLNHHAQDHTPYVVSGMQSSS